MCEREYYREKEESNRERERDKVLKKREDARKSKRERCTKTMTKSD